MHTVEYGHDGSCCEQVIHACELDDEDEDRASNEAEEDEDSKGMGIKSERFMGNSGNCG